MNYYIYAAGVGARLVWYHRLYSGQQIYSPVAKSLAVFKQNTDSKVPGATMGPIWGQQDSSEPHVGPMNFAIWEVNYLGWRMCHT